MVFKCGLGALTDLGSTVGVASPLDLMGHFSIFVSVSLSLSLSWHQPLSHNQQRQHQELQPSAMIAACPTSVEGFGHSAQYSIFTDCGLPSDRCLQSSQEHNPERER